MPSTRPRILLHVAYYEAEQEYLRSLPLEHFMESTHQATQRKITLESLDLVVARRPDFQLFNELLVQYPLPKSRKFGQVVPDNMIVIHPEPSKAEGSYNIGIEPVGPFCVMDYVSKRNKRKDYEDSMVKYERNLKVPYYLLFLAEKKELTLYRHDNRKYVSVQANENGRHALPEVELEVAILDQWVRYWYQGELLPLPAEMQQGWNDTKKRLDEEAKARLTAEAEVARLRAELAKLRNKQ